MSEPTFGIVVPSLCGGPQLGRLLRSIRSQPDPPETTVVVGGGRSVDVAEDSRKFGCKFVIDPGLGDRRSHAKNLGASAAGTQFVLFLDDDMEVTDDLIGECRSIMRQGMGALFIPEETKGAGLLGKVRKWERALVERDLFVCFPRALKYEIFVAAGGFDEGLAGFEDLDLTATLIERGISMGRTKAKLIHHEENVTLNQYLRKRAHYALGAKTYRTKHPAIGGQVLSPVRRIRLYLGGVRNFRDVPLFVIAVALRVLELPQS